MKKFALITAILITALLFLACVFPLNDPASQSGRNPLSPPVNVSAVTQTATSVDVSWTAVGGAGIYTVYRAGDAAGPFAQITSLTANTYTDTVAANGIYYYRVSASADNRGESSLSNIASVVTRIPAAPTNITVIVQSATSMKIEWLPSPGADEYRVYRNGSFVSTITGNFYTDTGLTISTDYSYEVSSKNNIGESAKSSAVTASTKTPEAPADLTAGAASASSIIVSWSETPNATSYKIYLSSTAAGTYTYLGQSTTTSFTHSGVSSGNTYYYEVSAVNAIGEGARSAYVQGMISLPAVPGNIRLTPLSSSSIKIEWDPVPGAVLYTIDRSMYYYSNRLTTSTSSTSYTDTGLSSGWQYYYQVSATNAVGTGSKSTSQYSYTMPVTLNEEQWYADTVSNCTQHLYDAHRDTFYQYYSFPATGGTCYVQWGNASHTGEGYNNYPRVDAFWKSDNSMTDLSVSYFTNQASSFTSPKSFNASPG
ncbi:MAG: fibronectin type III domain-containing protein, partial [Treponema sp.]|nr:fibronectin type III domain-containing protein [Treponema sp.]